MIKIKRQNKLLHYFVIVLLIILLIYTRFVNLNWGLPYPMHPDERNMANALQQLQCEASIINLPFSIRNCFNPHFYAYGQFPLYLGYLLIKVFKGFAETRINFEEAVMSLRIISAVASVINVIVLLKIVELLKLKLTLIKSKQKSKLDFKSKIYKSLLTNNWLLITILFFTFPPFFIQFSHFGTTESLLMLFYSLIIYYSLKISESKILNIRYLILSSLFIGLATATKISSLVFIAVPVVVLLNPISYKRLFLLGKLIGLSFLFGLIFSPHNLISYQDFLNSIRYESNVALGQVLVFYTRQFFNSMPIWFQMTKIFPYALGWPIFIFGILGFLLLSWQDKKINLLRFAFLIYFLPNAFLFTKWTRFMTPIFPIILIFSLLFILWFKNNFFSIALRKIKISSLKNKKFFIENFLFFVFYLSMLIPGIAYLSVYRNPDVRFVASEWIYKNIEDGAYILSETANVVDLPLIIKGHNPNKNYQIISFNFYDLDENLFLQEELKYHLSKADYIFVPSRRIYANHYCSQKIQSDRRCQILEQRYPLLNDYYDKLFNGQLNFKPVAKFESFPKIKFQIFNFKFQIIFPDEEAEETWSVFDHPVIRIYKRIES